jgi:hypothetical protein
VLTLPAQVAPAARSVSHAALDDVRRAIAFMPRR